MDNGFNDNFETMIFEYIDKIKYLLSPEIWGNGLFNCSKNEVFVLLLYRRSDVNMTQIADYLRVPLNTACRYRRADGKAGFVSPGKEVQKINGWSPSN